MCAIFPGPFAGGITLARGRRILQCHQTSKSESLTGGNMLAPVASCHVHRRALMTTLMTLLLFQVPLRAQSSGAIAGAITDTTGGAVPGATVSVTNQATGLKWSTLSGTSGDYQIAALPTGQYQLEVQAPGFQTRLVKNVPVAVAQTTMQNVQLSVGQISDTLTVEATAPIVQSSTMAVGQVVDHRTVQEIPLNGRHFVDLGLLLPGSVVQPQNGFLTAPLRGQGAFAFNTAGNREDTVNFMVNGINLNDKIGRASC